MHVNKQICLLTRKNVLLIKNFFYVDGQGVLTVKAEGNNLKTIFANPGRQLNTSALDNAKVINDTFRGLYYGLKDIILPTTLERIGADAFKGCTSLATVNLGQLDKLTTIGDNAFGGCTSLKEVALMGKRDITLGKMLS